MADIKDVIVPDVGGEEVEVIEVLVAVGDSFDAEDSLITVESDKASMDVPAPFAGTVTEILINVGDKVGEGSLIFKASSSEDSAPAEEPAEEPVAEEPIPTAEEKTETPAAPVEAAPVASGEPEVKEVTVPDIGGETDVEIIEVLVAVGDQVEAEDGLITLETDKATMDVPAPFAGKVVELKVEVGGKASEGTLVALMETKGETASEPSAEAAPAPAAEKPIESAPAAAPTPEAAKKSSPVPSHPSQGKIANAGTIYASPAIRRLASEFGVDLSQVKGTGRKGRIQKEDVQSYVKYELSRPKMTSASSVGGGAGGLQVLPQPKVDFSKFGEIEEKPLTRIQKISGPNLHRNWVTIPHVTQFDEADITDLEAFRKEQNALLQKQKKDIKITPLAFMIKAAASALEAYPVFNSSLSADGESIIQKKYYHIGIAVDTPNGLVVPVVRDVDQKGIFEISKDLMEISAKARDGKLKAQDMQGSCFSISSLGGIGGTAFTPIVNAPDVAILGVSKSEMKPKWNGSDFEPRLMLPLSLSYDHRVIDGAVAARFTVHLSQVLGDLRKLIL
jgi:pyruvate dehydrogenase E2 component (dihydrolipoamide acetyltransferase)